MTERKKVKMPIGRPPVKNPKEHSLVVSVDKHEKYAFRSMAAQEGLSVSSYVRGRLWLNRSVVTELGILRRLADYASRQHCTHEETHRGGFVWEICVSCGARWADDEGGKPKDAHELPGVILEAYKVLGFDEEEGGP